MKKVVGGVLLLLVFAGCGQSKLETRVKDLEAKNAALEQRVKSLEDELLQSEKQLVQHDQALRATAERMREMENYFNKLQFGESVR